eukprot:6198533-Pleurochrysis_carterae.AAC.4
MMIELGALAVTLNVPSQGNATRDASCSDKTDTWLTKRMAVVRCRARCSRLVSATHSTVQEVVNAGENLLASYTTRAPIELPRRT